MPSKTVTAPARRPGGALRSDGVSWRLRMGQQIPLRDGLSLHANLYLPEGDGPFLTLLQLTPYTAESAHTWAARFAAQGFAFVVVNCRGRGGSQGQFEPFETDGEDGCDAVQWAAAQPWCDGRVVMTGGSYAGFTQWATARHRPAGLAAITPIAAVYPGWDFPAMGGITASYSVRWLSVFGSSSGSEAILGDAAMWTALQRDAVLNHRGLDTVAEVLGPRASTWHRWQQHPMRDDYWRSLVPSAAQYAAIRIPVLTVTGQYDGDQPGALAYRSQHLRHAGHDTRHDLLCGPWDHGGTRWPRREVFGLRFGAASVIDMPLFIGRWIRHVLDDGPRPPQLPQRVSAYLQGAERWVYGEALESLLRPVDDLHLSAPRGTGLSVRRPAALLSSPPAAHEAGFVRNPLDVREALLELKQDRGLIGGHASAALRGTGLVFESAPLQKPFVVAGRPVLEVCLMLDRPDADFLVWFEEVRADGVQVMLGRDKLRARHRLGVGRSDLARPGQALVLRFPRANWLAVQLRKGSRLRVVLAGLVSSQHERNPHGPDAVATSDLREGKPVRVTLRLGADPPCRLRFELSASEIDDDDRHIAALNSRS